MQSVRVVVTIMLTTLLALPWQQAAAQDPFGQTVEPAVEEIVVTNRGLRLPYGKTADKAVADARAAATALHQVVGTHPRYFRAWFNLALAQAEAGDYAAARKSFDEAIKIRDEEKIPDITVLNSAGWVSLNNGDYGKAEQYLLRALKEIDKGTQFTNAAVHNNLGQLYFFTQRLDEAEKFLKIAKDLGTGSATRTLDIIAATRAIVKNTEQMKQ
jgi:tetratricopeptide (TPR) repeat protein